MRGGTLRARCAPEDAEAAAVRRAHDRVPRVGAAVDGVAAVALDRTGGQEIRSDSTRRIGIS